jgi:hypothetical protein
MKRAKLVDEVVDVDEVERAHALPDQAGGLIEQRDVVLDLIRRVRPLHLDDHLVAVRQHRAVHLADRRRRDRRLAELEERLLERQAQLLLDHLAHLCERERRSRRPAGRGARRRCPGGRRPGASRAAART